MRWKAHRHPGRSWRMRSRHESDCPCPDSRYPSAIRDFRGSLTTDIEKGVLITTGAFSKAAREEASNPGKQQIDLIDGEELISKIAEFGIGVREVKSYEVDEEFFKKI